MPSMCRMRRAQKEQGKSIFFPTFAPILPSRGALDTLDWTGWRVINCQTRVVVALHQATNFPPTAPCESPRMRSVAEMKEIPIIGPN